MVQLHPFVELYLDQPEGAAWPTLSVDAPAHVRLHGDMSALEIGSVVATLVRYNNSEQHATGMASPERLRTVLTGERIILPGGVMAHDDASGITITSGCCCGLEEWRVWVDFLDHGDSPWLGHDPSPYLVRHDDAIDICVMHGEPESEVRLSMSRSDYVRQLGMVEQQLSGAVTALRTWADTYVPDDSTALVARFVSTFGGAPKSA
jgi:hypothetical protein